MRQVELSKATLEELRDFAASQNLEVPVRATQAQLRSLIASSGWTSPNIELDDDLVEPVMVERPRPEGSRTIIIVKTETETGDVFIGCNDKNWFVQRGVQVTLPKEAIESLMHSVRKVPLQDEEGQIIGWHEVPAYPFAVVG